MFWNLRIKLIKVNEQSSRNMNYKFTSSFVYLCLWRMNVRLPLWKKLLQLNTENEILYLYNA